MSSSRATTALSVATLQQTRLYDGNAITNQIVIDYIVKVSVGEFCQVCVVIDRLDAAAASETNTARRSVLKLRGNSLSGSFEPKTLVMYEP